MNKIVAVGVGVVAAAGFAVGVALAEEAAKEESPSAKVFAAKCVMCHGTDAKGNAKMAKMFKLETSAESHPFYTGAQTRIVETGRVEKFRQKFAAKTEQVNAAAKQASAAKARRK